MEGYRSGYNAKLGGAIMKPKNIKCKFWFVIFLVKGERRTRDVQSRYVCCSRQKTTSELITRV